MTAPTKRNGSTRAWRKLRARLLTRSTTCHLCGGPGADTVDHVIPIALGGALLDERNCRPAHAWCNTSKGARYIAPPATATRPSRRDPGPSREW